MGAVNIGGIPKVDAKIERKVEDADGFVIVAFAVSVGHAHAA